MYKTLNFLKYNIVPILLLMLSIYDLRVDIKLLFDYFTISTLLYTIIGHPLSITVLLLMPYLFGSVPMAFIGGSIPIEKNFREADYFTSPLSNFFLFLLYSFSKRIAFFRIAT